MSTSNEIIFIEVEIGVLQENKEFWVLPCAGVVTSVRVSERHVSVSANRAASDAEGSAPEN